MTTVDRTRLSALMQREQKRFVDERPKSKSIYERGKMSPATAPDDVDYHSKVFREAVHDLAG